MLIDDDEVYQFIFSQTVSNAGIQADVITFKTGEEGLNYLRSLKESKISEMPDLIFLDINMPAMNGWDFLEEYKKLNISKDHQSAFTMVSSSVFDSDKEKAEGYKEVVGFVVKPLSADDLKRIYYTCVAA